MKKFLAAVAAWLTPDRRQAIQGATAAILPLLVYFRLITAEHVAPVVVIVTAVLQLAAGLLALAHLSRGQYATWFSTTFRGVIYGFASAIAPALTLLGVWTDPVATQALALISTALTALSAVVAIVNKPAAT